MTLLNSTSTLKKLQDLQATDCGEDFLQEIIFYDKEITWSSQGKFVRLRKNKVGTKLCFKHHRSSTQAKTIEIEFEVGNFEKAKRFLEEVGLIAFREQEKKRHSFVFEGVEIDIDTWPSIPTYVELEGRSIRELKKQHKN